MRARRGASSFEMLAVVTLVALGSVAAMHTLRDSVVRSVDAVRAAIESLSALNPGAFERGQVPATPASASATPSERAPDTPASRGEEGLGTGGKVLVGLAGAATGVAVGIGVTAGTAYVASLACGPAAPVCAGAVTLGLLGYAGYELYNGGFAQLRGAFGRVFSTQRASVADAFTVGATLGGIAYGAGASFGRGAALQRGLVARAARAGLEQRDAIARRLATAQAARAGTASQRIPGSGDAEHAIDELPRPGASDDLAALTRDPDAHTLARHGGSVTDEQLQYRARTGVAPDGSTLAGGKIPPISSAFNSDADAVRALAVARAEVQRKLATMPAGTTVVRIDPVDTGSVIGRGFRRIGSSNPNNHALLGPLQRLDNLTRVQGTFRYNPTTGTWDPITMFPAP